MKIIYNSILIALGILMVSGCQGRASSKRNSAKETGADTVSVPDTGFTGITKYSSGKRIVKEVTFKNGVRQGEMKTYYIGGQLYQRFWYEKGLREDSALWYYVEGQVFRVTPFKHDTIDGVQKQFYRTGEIRARMKYIKGFRTPFLEEFTREGKLVKGYPDIAFTLTDNYKTTGKLRVNLELTNKATKVRFYRGEFAGGIFDTTKCVKLKTVNGKAFLDLKKTGSPQKDYVGLIGEILTDFGNNYLTYKKIDLPYKDLN